MDFKIRQLSFDLVLSSGAIYFMNSFGILEQIKSQNGVDLLMN